MEHKISKSSLHLREKIEKAIDDEVITREEYDEIIHIALEDGVIDKHEKALLSELQQMIEDKVVKFAKKK
jgi:transcriptional regulator CtsR